MPLEEEPKITSVEKPKDPRRVAAGKKLAQISKEAKERKLRQKIQEEEGSSSGYTLIAVGGLVLTGASLYYTYKSYTKEPKPEPKPEPRPEPKPECTFDILD